jgi:hypothetical protein
MAAEAGANGEEFAVGCILSLRTTLGDDVEGQIIAFDRPSNLLVIHILSYTLLIHSFLHSFLTNPLYFIKLFSAWEHEIDR